MSDPFLAEIRQFGFNFAPRGWAQCDGQILPINQNQSLYSLLGTTYGGDGRTTFALPDLRSRNPMHVGSGFNLGRKDGVERVTLSTTQMPTHNHTAGAPRLHAAVSGDVVSDPTLNSLAPANAYSSDPPSVDMDGNSFTSDTANAGGGQSHENQPPFLAINFCIAIQGVFPSRN